MGASSVTRNERHEAFDLSSLVQLPGKLQNHFKSQLGKFAKKDKEATLVRMEVPANDVSIDLERQLQTWRENPSWFDQPPEIKVSVPKGSLCNLNVDFNVGLPPDAVYNIVTNPDNKRVFKNIKEVISRDVLLDEGHRQVVELEQAAIWKFLWWSGTFSVRVLVDQNRQDLTMKFKQVKSGFMKQFEGCWRIEPVFVDEHICHPFKPKNLEEYCSCTGGKGRIGSKVNLEQLIQPALVPPPPISWYLRGITTRTTEMIANDLLAEAARIRGDTDKAWSIDSETCQDSYDEHQINTLSDIKERWEMRRRNSSRHSRRLLTAKIA